MWWTVDAKSECVSKCNQHLQPHQWFFPNEKTKQAATDQQVVSHPTSNVLNPSASWIPDIEISAQTAVSDPNNNKNDPDAENKCENDDKCYWSIT